MSRFYDKDKLKESLDLGQIFDLLEVWGGEPEYINEGILACTICHNEPGCGSRKLYYYSNTRLCHCYSGCTDPTFDIFDLCIKVMKIQKSLSWELYDAMDYIASYFGIEGEEQHDEKEDKLKDWEIFKRHERKDYQPTKEVLLPEYNPVVLTRFSYPRIAQWEREGISRDSSLHALVGYYAGNEVLTIPHYDIHGRLIGIRQRFLDKERENRFGKYRPLYANQVLYTHPLSMNLYNLNKSKKNIKASRVAILFESEKSCLLYQTYYGQDNDISVACCGSSVSSYHIFLLKSLGVRELIIGFDRQFQEIGDQEFQRLKNKLIHLDKKYGQFMKISAIFDKHMTTSYKAGPLDEGREKFERLLKERIIPR